MLCKIIDQYVSACVPSDEELKPTKAQDLDRVDASGIEHASLKSFLYDFDTNSDIDDVVVDGVNKLKAVREMLASVQLHFHTFTCFKSSLQCRFHFYKKLRAFSEFKFVRFSKRKAAMLRVLLKRNNKTVNDFNGFLILHQRSNMDLQFICNPYGTAVYSCWYSSKPEAPDQTVLCNKFLQFLAKEKNTPEFTRKKLFLAANAVYFSREISFQEIAWYLLGFPFVIRSKTIVEINLLPPSKRRKIIKDSASLATMNPDSREIFVNPTTLAPEVVIFMSLNRKYNEHRISTVNSSLDDNKEENDEIFPSKSIDGLIDTGEVNCDNAETGVSNETFELLNKYYANVEEFSLYHFLSR